MTNTCWRFLSDSSTWSALQFKSRLKSLSNKTQRTFLQTHQWRETQMRKTPLLLDVATWTFRFWKTKSLSFGVKMRYKSLHALTAVIYGKTIHRLESGCQYGGTTIIVTRIVDYRSSPHLSCFCSRPQKCDMDDWCPTEKMIECSIHCDCLSVFRRDFPAFQDHFCSVLRIHMKICRSVETLNRFQSERIL